MDSLIALEKLCLIDMEKKWKSQRKYYNLITLQLKLTNDYLKLNKTLYEIHQFEIPFEKQFIHSRSSYVFVSTYRIRKNRIIDAMATPKNKNIFF